MSKNSHFEVCSTVPLVINGSLAGILDFDEDIVSKAGSDSGGISSYDGSKNDTDSDYRCRTLDHISNLFTLQPKRVVAILYSGDSNCKVYNYHKVAGDNIGINISAMFANATMFNEYSFLERIYRPELER